MREIRARRGLSQEDAGLAGGLHRNYVGAIERAEVSPTFKTLTKLARGLNVPLRELLEVAERHAREGGWHVTQIRFHADTWRAIKAEAERLRISIAELIRCCVLLCLGQRQAEDRIAGLEARHDALAARVEGLARMITRVGERVGLRAR